MNKQSLLFKEVESGVSVQNLYTKLFSESKNSFWLDSSLVVEGYSRYSFIGDDQGENAKTILYRKNKHTVDIHEHSIKRTEGISIEEFIGKELNVNLDIAVGYQLPFATGFVGYLGYESLETNIDFANESSNADAEFVICDRFIAYDHVRNIYTLVVRHDETNAGAAQEWVNAHSDLLLSLSGLEDQLCSKFVPQGEQSCQYRDTESQYVSKVNECLDNIKAGETYEVTLTTEISTESVKSHLNIYKNLRAINPAPYAGFLKFEGVSLLCSSPERFLKIDEKRNMESRPIKGTAPRMKIRADDLEQKKALKESVKTRSENLMIVDLLRNDIGMVCEMGSVHVPSLMYVESYSTVHQLVTIISGKLKKQMPLMDAISAAFPGGSMTGAPKKRTMGIIEKIESRWRGPYSGSIGYISFNGQCDLNIVIRTIVARDHKLTIGVGGAVIALSDPIEEFEEAMLKARAPLNAILMAELDEQSEKSKQSKNEAALN